MKKSKQETFTLKSNNVVLMNAQKKKKKICISFPYVCFPKSSESAEGKKEAKKGLPLKQDIEMCGKNAINKHEYSIALGSIDIQQLKQSDMYTNTVGKKTTYTTKKL